MSYAPVICMYMYITLCTISSTYFFIVEGGNAYLHIIGAYMYM